MPRSAAVMTSWTRRSCSHASSSAAGPELEACAQREGRDRGEDRGKKFRRDHLIGGDAHEVRRPAPQLLPQGAESVEKRPEVAVKPQALLGELERFRSNSRVPNWRSRSAICPLMAGWPMP